MGDLRRHHPRYIRRPASLSWLALSMAKGSHSQSAARGKIGVRLLQFSVERRRRRQSVTSPSGPAAGNLHGPSFSSDHRGPSRQVFAHNPKSHITFACANSNFHVPPSFVYAVSPAQLLNRQGRSSACARLRVEWVMMATCAGRRRKRKPLFFFFFPLLRPESETRPPGRTTRRYYHGPPPVPALYIITPRTSRDVATRALKHPYSPTPLLPPLALKRVFTPA
jgi:hypothetical protein